MVEVRNDPHALAVTSPKEWYLEHMLKEAYIVIVEHYKEYHPSWYEKWLVERSTFSCPHIIVRYDHDVARVRARPCAPPSSSIQISKIQSCIDPFQAEA